MMVSAFPAVSSKEDIKKNGRAFGGILGRVLLLNRKPTSIRLFYIEFKIIRLNISYKPSWIDKILTANNRLKGQNMSLIVDGTCGAAALIDSRPPVVRIEVDENRIQYSDLTDDELLLRARKTATRILRRHIGGFPMIDLFSIDSVFRPYWIVFYGDPKPGHKVRYIPVPADGCSSNRTF